MTDEVSPAESPTEPDNPIPKRSIFHVMIGGGMMGTADVIPGVSGGTMLVATGLYDQFIQSVSDLTRFRFRRESIIFLVLLGIGDVTAILTMSGVIEWGLTSLQHIMYALFIGLTLGGVPVLAKSIKPLSTSGVGGIISGFLFMILVSFALRQLDLPVNFIILMMGGFIASSAMVLPGISGSYLLLMLGLYAPILEGVSAFKDALKAMDIGQVLEIGFSIGLPVLLGVIAGIALLSNAIRIVLKRYHEPTVGVLMGLLLGSVVSLYPFRAPGPKDLFEQAAPITALNAVLVMACIALGFIITMSISRLDKEGEGIAAPDAE